jgi:hypothetical protein
MWPRQILPRCQKNCPGKIRITYTSGSDVVTCHPEAATKNTSCAQHSVHLTAFGAGMHAAIPLQGCLFADDLSAIIGGR